MPHISSYTLLYRYIALCVIHL